MANENLKGSDRLQELKGSGFEIVDGQPDIRGWDIKDRQGRTYGEVDELIFDVKSRKVRYMVVDLDDNEFDLAERKVLVPIGIAELHEENDDVILANVTESQLAALPEYKKGNILSDTEAAIRNALGTSALAGAAGLAGTSGDDNFYNHDHFNESNLYRNREARENTTAIPIIEESLQVGKKTVETGGARLHTTIVEKPVEESVNLREEHITIERKAVDRPVTQSDLANSGETTIELTERAEIPVVSKDARVVEEVSIGKEVQEREETIHDTVRKTAVDIENIEPDDLRTGSRSSGTSDSTAL